MSGIHLVDDNSRTVEMNNASRERKNQLLSGVELKRRDWKSSTLHTELQLSYKKLVFPIPYSTTSHWGIIIQMMLTFPGCRLRCKVEACAFLSPDSA